MNIVHVVQQIALGVRSLMLHKLRSALAVLGILIGVTAVIWLVAMGEGVAIGKETVISVLPPSITAQCRKRGRPLGKTKPCECPNCQVRNYFSCQIITIQI